MSVFIGRQLSIGIGKESTRGTAVAAAYWVQKTDFMVEDRIDTIADDASIAVIEDSQQQEIVKKFSEGSIGGRITDITFGIFLMALFGTDTVTAVGGETLVKDHVFSVLQTAQHPSLTLIVNEPNATGASSLAYALCMLDSMNIHIEVGKWSTYKAGFRGNANGTTSPTVSYIVENGFNPQFATASFAPTLAGVQGTLTATGTAVSTVNVTALSINTNLLQVGMTVTGTNVPVGATVATIISSTAFTLSIATTGAMGSITFGGVVVNMRMVDINVMPNLEDDPTIGQLAVADRYNKQFAVEGSFQLVYKDRSYIDTIMLGDLNKALRLKAANTAVVIGTAVNPTITIDLALVNLKEVTRTDKNNDVMLQTIKFKAFYSIPDTQMCKITLRNTQVATY